MQSVANLPGRLWKTTSSDNPTQKKLNIQQLRYEMGNYIVSTPTEINDDNREYGVGGKVLKAFN